MRYFHRLTSEESVEALLEIMMSLDDDLEITVRPMRRDSHWDGVRVYLKRDGLHWVPDPLYCHLMWLDAAIQESIEREKSFREFAQDVAADIEHGRVQGVATARDHLVARLDAAWGM